MRYPWQHLPESLREALLQASSGRVHLLNTAVEALEAVQAPDLSPEARQTLLQLGSGLLLAAFEEQPFESTTLERLISLDRSLPFLEGRLRVLVSRLGRQLAVPGEATKRRLELATRQGDNEALLAMAEEGLAHEPGNLFWIGLAQHLGVRENRLDWLRQHLLAASALPAAFKAAMLADVAFLQGDLAAAEQGYTEALAAFPLGLWSERLGEALIRLGRRDEGLHVWEGVLAERPWQTQLWGRRDLVRNGLDTPGEFPAGQGVMLLYTWNGGAKIRQTLAALAASELPPFTGTAQILLLDNGSTDPATLAALHEHEALFAGRLRLITLPCNIGAPPARNWLLTEPEARAADWLVFLDDDLTVPADWLRRFGAIMAHKPGHGVYGCQILREDRPLLIQGVDMHVLPPSQTQGPGWLPASPVHMQASFYGENIPDFGQFAYARPCVHVAGCCHLFRADHLARAGGFDLRFAPTQVDDYEHDIRMAASGDWPLYHGGLRVRHHHATGLSTRGSLPRAMNAHANHLKLQALYPPDVCENLRRAATQVLLQDTVKKQR